MMNNYKFLDWITIISFVVGIYALYIALENLDLNDKQNADLKDILNYLEQHLQDQDNHLKDQDIHLAKQDKLLERLGG